MSTAGLVPDSARSAFGTFADAKVLCFWDNLLFFVLT